VSVSPERRFSILKVTVQDPWSTLKRMQALS